MSAPCFARMIAEGATSAFVRTATQRGDVPQHLVFGHEPMLNGEKLAVQLEFIPRHEQRRYVEGLWHRLCVCRHCHAIVLIPEHALPTLSVPDTRTPYRDEPG